MAILATALAAWLCYATVNQEDSSDVKKPKLEINYTDRETMQSFQGKMEEFQFDKIQNDKQIGFKLNGVNSTPMIRGLTSLAGKSIAELETQMRPGAPGPGGSTAGFLGPQESLLEVLEEDNILVVDKLGLTHQQLAAPFLILTQLRQANKSGVLKFGDRVFYIAGIKSSNGFQHSPFGDELKCSEEFTIFDPTTKQKLKYSVLVPQMIYRYGFYEGQGTRYRIAPKKIIDFFGQDLLKSINLGRK